MPGPLSGKCASPLCGPGILMLGLASNEGLGHFVRMENSVANIAELTDPAGWEDWVASRPPVVADLCRRYPPDRLYMMKPTMQRVTLVSYSENGTVTVDVGSQWNFVTFEREVFGVDPANLEECDLPADDEPTGAVLTTESSVRSYCEVLRADMLAKGPNVRAKRATTAGRQARAGENVPRTARPGLVACRWRSA